ncbi:GNAT family N-acetyltransferase [Carnobacterium gallinarum]|uniref:GNAT family N-acetyltransferase n=1 Tax=Carnobacterium gallinarum TaxID=2749 RepID=UPI000553681B|nr:GNAT family N-acetyltransferase [Carnobacterium gallinarum]
MEFQWTTDLNSVAYQDGLNIRKKVFIEGQQVDPAIEIDDLENKTLHVIGYSNNIPAAVARIYPIKENNYKIQRVAVLAEFRGQHLGEDLMIEIERTAREAGVHALVLGAQDHAIGFYEKLNYQIDGAGFVEANIPHHNMKKILA